MSKNVKFSVKRPEMSLGFVFWQTTNLWQRKIAHALKELDLTHVQFVLLAGIGWLNKEGIETTQTMVSQHAKTDIMMTSKVVRTLESKKLITRQTHSTDPRAKSLKLTAAGADVLHTALKIVEAADTEFFGTLMPADRQEFSILLQNILNTQN